MRIYTDAPPFKFRFSVADYLAFTEQQTRFDTPRDLHRSLGELQQRPIAELLRTRVVSWGFFSMLGIAPIARPRLQ